MERTSAMQFVAAARLISKEARRYGLDAPSFRSPPAVLGVDRTIRRRERGGVVAVSVRERPFVAVLADMIEGVVVVNRLASPEADQVRTALWTMLDVMGVVASAQVVDDADLEVPRVA